MSQSTSEDTKNVMRCRNSKDGRQTIECRTEKRSKEQIRIYKTPHRKQKIEQHQPNTKEVRAGVNRVSRSCSIGTIRCYC